MIDKLIMDAVSRDQNSLGVSSLKPKFMVGTGLWKMIETEDGDYIMFTDDFISKDEVFTVYLNKDCEMIDGEQLLLLTSVSYYDMDCSLVLFKDQAFGGSVE